MLNEASITFQIEATGPILIKDGKIDDEMRFVVDANDEIFIPGSSIRGVWRSWCEKIARTISEKDVPLSCDPFDKNIESIHLSCSERLKKNNPSTIYGLSCPICKIFGNTSLGSRIRISDAYLSDKGSKTNKDLRKRDGIGIDRFTGGVSHGANFSYQYVMGRTFETKVHIRNFELWQLGLLEFLLRDFREELVPIGFGKTRGLGRVKGTVESMSITYYGLDKPKINESTNTVKISGIGSLYDDSDRKNYHFADESAIEDVEFEEYIENPIKLILKFDGSQAKSLFERSAPYWAKKEGDTKDGYYKKSQLIRKDTIYKNENVEEVSNV